MPLYLDIKYANLLAPKLKKFKWKGRVGNFRCPFCGDSSKSKIKKRGYLYEAQDELWFFCHNGCDGKHFKNFLKELDSSLYKEYNYETFKANASWDFKEVPKADFSQIKRQLKSAPVGITNNLVSIDQLDSNHPARLYVSGRKIPEKFWKKLFYTENYKKWINENVEEGKFERPERTTDERILIPFLDKNGRAIAYQGRYIGKDERKQRDERYLTIKSDERNVPIFGMDEIDITKTIYVLEGPFDSMFLPNALAVAGSQLKKLIRSKLDIVYVFDNEPRSASMIKLMAHVIEKNKKIVIWPYYVKTKDVNDMILIESLDVLKVINDNTYQGLKAKLKFNNWKCL